MNITIDEIDGGVRAHVAEPRLDAALAGTTTIEEVVRSIRAEA